ncbi:MAG: hypothetical protein AAGJ90_05520 [Pseudomonadota bacterium]|uniref:hypothetical protein n=1 Tax=Vibrio campbellii TaxID=680 RepID=UPI001D179643|nr:hypothetical protein [Vibrio campbellii]MCC4224724.1 hypothetical protein [Vibrio campbellii]
MIGYEEMAISGYLGWLLAVLLIYPFAYVGIHIGVFDIKVRTKVSRYFNRIVLALIAFLLIMHMQTEVVYGKYFLGLWGAQQ